MPRTSWTLIPAIWVMVGLASAQEVDRAGEPGDSPPLPAAAEAAQRGEAGQPHRLVYPLKHTAAMEVANTIREILRSEGGPEAGPVLVLPEPIGNRLVISGSPAVCGQIVELVEQLDRQPAMVSLELLIAEVTYREAEPNPAGAASTGEQTGAPEVVGLPGDSRFTPEQLLRELGVEGPAGSTAAGGTDAVASKRQKPRRLEVLSRVQLTATNNRPASLQIGKREPVVRGTQVSRTGGRVNNVTMENVGLLVSVTPQIAPDGQVTMELQLEESRLGATEEGALLASGEGVSEVRMPAIVTTTLETTVTAADGQSVVLGGMITKSGSRRVDLLILVCPRIVHGGTR